jgi:hypothetical protein
MVVVDGAGIRGAEGLCHHGVAWYAHTLGAEVVDRLRQQPVGGLRDAVAESIETVTAAHSDTCEVADPSSPQASIAVMRDTGDGVDYLVLGDVYLIVEAASPLVITDRREVAVRQEALKHLTDLLPGTPEHDHELRRAIDSLRAARNHPGGYWIAKDDPRAAAEAVVGRLDTGPLGCLAILSNGAARLVEPYGVTDWQGMVELLHAVGPDGVLHRLRVCEKQISTTPDDASVAYRRARH